METPSALARARQDLVAAAARLRRLKQTASDPSRPSPRLDAWRALRLEVESLQQALESWTTTGEAAELSEELAARKTELEKRAARAEERLERADALRAQADGFSEEALAELDRVRRAWRLLRAEAKAEGALPREGDLAAVLGRLQAALTAGERALDEERRSRRENWKAWRSWRWIVEAVYPDFEAKASPGDGLLLLPTIRRLLEELDGRWKAACVALWRRHEPPREDEPASAVLAAAETDAERRERLSELERVTAIWKAEVASLREAMELHRANAAPELKRLTERLAYERKRANAYRVAFKLAAKQIRALRERLAGS